MKVIHLISGGDSGGAKTHVLSLLTELNKTIDADLVCFMRSSFTEEAQALGIPLTVFDRSFADGVRRVRRMVDEGGYDVIHCHGSRANLIGAILKRHVAEGTDGVFVFIKGAAAEIHTLHSVRHCAGHSCLQQLLGLSDLHKDLRQSLGVHKVVFVFGCCHNTSLPGKSIYHGRMYFCRG